MEVSILGQIYTIIERKRADDPKLEFSDGYCETQSKKIIICDIIPEKDTLEKVVEYKKQVIRHEIIHAFLFESGLDDNSPWARNEEIVDWIAIQAIKLLRAFSFADCL